MKNDLNAKFVIKVAGDFLTWKTQGKGIHAMHTFSLEKEKPKGIDIKKAFHMKWVAFKAGVFNTGEFDSDGNHIMTEALIIDEHELQV